MNDRLDPDELDPDDVEPGDDDTDRPDDDTEPDDTDRPDDDDTDRPDDDTDRPDDDTEPDDTEPDEDDTDRPDDDDTEPDDTEPDEDDTDRPDDDDTNRPDDDTNRPDDDTDPSDDTETDDAEPDDDTEADQSDDGVTGEPLVAAVTAGVASGRHGRDDGSLEAGDEPDRARHVSRWDGPPAPHDWRYFVGMVGRTLIVTGLLMFGFVGYQLWGTGLETARAQDRLGDEFDELVTAARPDATAPPNPTTTQTTTPVPTVTTNPDTDSPGDESDESDGASGDSTVAVASTTTVAPVEQDIPEILPGKALAKLEIPRMGKEGGDALLVVPGVDLDSLQQGPGHYPDTPLPGQLGNAAIAGHRTTWGEPFARIDELVPGDEIIVTMLTGDRFVYEVASTEIVSPDDYYVVQTSDPSVAELTLTSCHPRWSARQRIAVHAFLQPEESAPVGEPTYYDLEANDGDRAGEADESGDDPTITLPDDTATAVDDGDTRDTAGADDSSGDAGVVAVPGPDGPDALTAGWFHDSAAWPQIALWGAVCSAIAALAYRISRRFRNYAIGWSIAIVPFVVALYFLYQNVNRLLPPASDGWRRWPLSVGRRGCGRS